MSSEEEQSLFAQLWNKINKILVPRNATVEETDNNFIVTLKNAKGSTPNERESLVAFEIPKGQSFTETDKANVNAALALNYLTQNAHISTSNVNNSNATRNKNSSHIFWFNQIDATEDVYEKTICQLEKEQQTNAAKIQINESGKYLINAHVTINTNSEEEYSNIFTLKLFKNATINYNSSTITTGTLLANNSQFILGNEEGQNYNNNLIIIADLSENDTITLAGSFANEETGTWIHNESYIDIIKLAANE